MYNVESLLKMSREEVIDLWFNGNISWELKNQVEDIRYERNVLEMKNQTLFDAIKTGETDWDSLSVKIAKNKIKNDYGKSNNLLDNHSLLNHEEQIENMRQMEQATRELDEHIATVQQHVEQQTQIDIQFNNTAMYNHIQFVNNF